MAEELEKFRQQWQEEVTARSKRRPFQSTSNQPPNRASSPPSRRPTKEAGEAIEDLEEHGYHDLEDRDEERRLGELRERIHPSIKREPTSALDHYEFAVERESEGSLGDSLKHYRKAFRLDAAVDRIYKNKHFPPSTAKSKPQNPNPSNVAVTIPNPAHHSLDGPPISSIPELIFSFASLSIPRSEPPTDASPAPPCPISTIPSEILNYILLSTAIADPASFARLACVCKHLAYLVATEDRIWRRICEAPEYGFSGMQYDWACTLFGAPLPTSVFVLSNSLTSLSLASPTLPLSPSYLSYKNMFHTRPRLRYNGCYISTVNYHRPGVATASQATWNSPVLIVTYYRYLRFYRDGTCISLLTTTEPGDVVHYLTRENMHKNHAGGLLVAVMNSALRGRWKLSGNPYHAFSSNKNTDNTETEPPIQDEGTLHIETEGADAGSKNPKYVYKMMLQLQNASKGRGRARNIKLGWLGYWSYNRLTDDWAEFGLGNDRAFFWSRVRSYGSGD